MKDERLPWEEEETAQNIAPVQHLPFTAVSVFQGALTPETIVSTLLDEYSAVEAFVICKKWAELFAGSGSGDNKKPGAADIIKERATLGITEKKMPISFNGVVIAEVSEKKLAEQWLHKDSTLDAIDAEIKALKEKRKEREEFLKTVPEGMVDTATGEIITPSQRLTAGSTIAVKFKR